MRKACIGRRLWLASLAGVGLEARAATPRGGFAAADWAAAETLLALGIVPCAVTDAMLYRDWLPEIPLPPDIPDLGSRAEPNLELLALLRPDRILISNWQANLRPLLDRIAPTETVAIVDARRDAFANARDALVQLADMTGRAEAAAACLRAFDTALPALAGRLEHRAGLPVMVGVLHEGGSQIFAYGHGSWVDTMIARLGLRNALTRPVSLFGNALIDLAQLAESLDATLLYLDQGERTRRAERLLRDSTLWRSLPMVRAGRLHRIPPFYALGGLPSVLRCARLMTEALAGTGHAR